MHLIVKISSSEYQKLVRKHFKRVLRRVKIESSLKDLIYKYVYTITKNTSLIIATFCRLLLLGSAFANFKDSLEISIIQAVIWLYLVSINIFLFIRREKNEAFDKNKDKYHKQIVDDINKESK